MGKPSHKKYVVERSPNDKEKAETDKLTLQIEKLLKDEKQQKKQL